MKRLWAPWRMAYVSAVPSPTGEVCWLCEAAKPGVGDQSLVVDRGSLAFVLMNRYPYTSGHLLVAPVRHVAGVLALTPEEGAAIFANTQRAVRALTDAMHPDGFNIGINQGSAAGASAEHVHLHVVPRWSGDTNFMPVIGDVKVLPQDLETTAANLREAFVRLGPL
ncbi:MAG: HIT domain-containing protein [Candidatus Dormiibacterota bacterium]